MNSTLAALPPTPLLLGALSPAARQRALQRRADDAPVRYARQRRVDAREHGYRGPLTREEAAKRVWR